MVGLLEGRGARRFEVLEASIDEHDPEIDSGRVMRLRPGGRLQRVSIAGAMQR